MCQYFRKALWGLCIVAIAYTFPTHANSSSLRLNTITFDTTQTNDIRQIVFVFNQNVAVLGALPSQVQIDAVFMSHNLSAMCRWRFVKLHMLACELNAALPLFANIEIALTSGFSGLNKTIDLKNSSVIRTQILTDLPDTPIRINDYNEHFPHTFGSSIYIRENPQKNSQVFALHAHVLSALQLKDPSGKRHPLTVNSTQKRTNYSAFSIEIPSASMPWPNGDYQIVLPQGFTIPETLLSKVPRQYRRLEQDLAIKKFSYSRHFEYYGMFCGPNNNEYTPIYPGTNKYVKCSPEALSFGFSRKLDHASMSPPNQIEWLEGPAFNYAGMNEHNNVYYYRLNLQGNSEYRFIPANIQSEQGEFLTQARKEENQKLATAAFITASASSKWYLSRPLLNVVEADRSTAINIVRQNVSDMRRSLLDINSPENLQTYLNNGHQNAIENEPALFTPAPNTITSSGVQAVKFREALQQASGLVEASISGSHLPNISGYTESGEAIIAPPVQPKKERILVNSAAFNLVLWQHQNLLIQAVDWDANSLANASVSLVCARAEMPIELGATNAQGLLFLPSHIWSEIYDVHSENNCWLWASHSTGSAAIRLNAPQNMSPFEAKVFAFTAQPVYEPGDTVHIGLVAKQRQKALVGKMPGSNKAKENGPIPLLPLTTLDTYELLITRPNSDEVYTQLELGALSPNGLGSTSFTIDDQDGVGNYGLVIKNKINNTSEWIGEVKVQEFTPPEFEMSLVLPQKATQARINKGDTLQANISAKRLNGGHLVNAKVITHYSVNRLHIQPKTWPSAYEFYAYNDFNSQTPKQNKQNSFDLDARGELEFESPPITVNHPVANIVFRASVTTDDGETQNSQDNIVYLSQNHYVGSKISDDGQYLELIGINKDGERLSNIEVNLSFSRTDRLNRNTMTPQTIVANCASKTLPTRCKLPLLDTQLKVVISSHEITENILKGTSKRKTYESIRNIYGRTQKPNESTIDYPQIRFDITHNAIESDEPNTPRLSTYWTEPSTTATVGKALVLHLKANVSGTATFMVVAGNIQKVWQQGISEGNNAISLPIEAAWIPSAKLVVSMPVARQHIEKMTQHLRQSAEQSVDANTDVIDNTIAVALSSVTGVSITPQLASPSQQRRSSNAILNAPQHELGQYRLLSASVDIQVSPDKLEPTVSIVPASETMIAGGKLDITLASNSDVETQLWLVNDGIIAMVNMQLTDLNPANLFTYESQINNQLSAYSLARSLLTVSDNVPPRFEKDNKYRLGGFSDLETVSVSGARAQFAENLGQAVAHQSNVAKKDFAQSVWLDRLSLQANTPKTVTVKLPQLIGRWKIIAVNVSTHQSSTSSARVSTTRDVEYFVDAPSAIFDNDTAHVAITQINNTRHAVEDELTVLINGKATERINISLTGKGETNSYRRVQLPIPSLSPGTHRIMVLSKLFPDFAAYAELQVLSSTMTQQSAWLVAPANQSLIPPANALVNSLKLTARPGESGSPNWSALTQYNQRYPHLCWEQTMSRAVSYAYSHNAQADWPEGTETLKALLNRQAEFSNYAEEYSYFTNTPKDPFLSAYTFLVHAWLKDSSTPIKANVEKMQETLREYIHNTKRQQVSALGQSMSLLALAYNNSITLDEALIMRSQIGTFSHSADTQAIVLQALALKHLGAETRLYNSILNAVSHHRYIDTHTSLFNQNSYQCFAALAYDRNTEARASIMSEVLKQQQQTGHFGNTFANAVCTYLLQDKKFDGPETALSFNIKENAMHYQYDAAQQYWLGLRYAQNFAGIEAQSNGLRINRNITVKRQDKWVELGTTALSIGDLVKTEITVHSPIRRQHIAITDSIAGGFEALNPALKKNLYSDNYHYNWLKLNAVEIRQGKAFWYLQYLPKGKTVVVYYSRVRHSGNFNLAPSYVEAMYRTDVHANTQSDGVMIK